MSNNTQQHKQLRAIGHRLKPCVTVAGNGLSESVVDEIFRALRQHELIKIKLAIAERDLRRGIVREISEITGADVVQEIGKVVLLFKKAAKPDPKLSNLRFLD